MENLSENQDALDKQDSQELMEQKKKRRKFNALYYWRGFGVLALIFFFGTLFLYYKDLSRLNAENALLEYNNNSLVEQLQVSRNIIVQQKSQLEVIQSKSVRKYTLQGIGERADEHAVLFWSDENNRIWLNSKWLERPDKDAQYQLWARQGEEIISLGTVAEAVDVLQKMRFIKQADEFLLTLEPFGGSTSPTMDNLISRAHT